MGAGLRVVEGGAGEPLLVLLHGLGATADVWDSWRPLLADRWPGRWIAPDLPGHGGSPPLDSYTFAGMAGAVATLVEPHTETVLLGHSLGGVVALSLAGGGRLQQVRAVIGLGIKTDWTQDELDRAGAIASRPTAWFATRDEAAARYLRVSGLDGLVPASNPAVDSGLRQEEGKWRLAMDQAAVGIGAPDLPELLASVRAPVTLARGERDPLNTDEQLARLDASAVTLPGLGHNAHVQDPALAFSLLGLKSP